MTYHKSTASVDASRVVLNTEENMVTLEIYTKEHKGSREKLVHSVYLHSFDDSPFDMFNGKLEMGDSFELLSAIREPQ